MTNAPYAYADAICAPEFTNSEFANAAGMEITNPYSLREYTKAIIEWVELSGYPSGRFDYVTVIGELNSYTTLVRVGWIVNNPMLMVFRNDVTEFAGKWHDGQSYRNAIPILREWNGIPYNYTD
jgi:hypothetical protein